jgi:tetratricopeptide (TPR) repeat protein
MENSLQNIRELLGKNEVKKAESLISRLLRDDLPDIQRAELLVQRSHSHLLNNNPGHGLEDLEIVRDIAPHLFQAPSTQSLLADCYHARSNRSDIEQAQQIYQNIIREFSQYSNLGWVHYQYGQILLNDDHVEQAKSQFQIALNKLSGIKALRSYCYERLGFIEFQNQRDCKLSLKLLQLATTTYPPEDNPIWLVSVHLLRSQVMLACGQSESAITAASAAVKIASLENDGNTLAEALFSASELLGQIDSCEERTISYLQLFLKNSPRPAGISITWSRAHELLGDAYFKQGVYRLAAEAYTSALEFNPDHPWETSISYQIAKCHYQQGDFKNTIAIIKRLLDASDKDGTPMNDYRVYDMLGNALFALTQYEAAADAYQMALSLASPSVEGLDKIKLYLHFSRQLLESNS